MQEQAVYKCSVVQHTNSSESNPERSGPHPAPTQSFHNIITAHNGQDWNMLEIFLARQVSNIPLRW